MSASAVTLPVAETLTVRSILSPSAAMPVLTSTMAIAANANATMPAERRFDLRVPMSVLTLPATVSTQREIFVRTMPNPNIPRDREVVY